MLRYFEPGDLGITIEEGGRQLWVRSVAATGAFARAGLQAGDGVAALDRQEVTTAEAFRRLLRARLVEEADTVLRVRRSGKLLDLPVPLRE
jgi:S1-C subfamily serine protease